MKSAEAGFGPLPATLNRVWGGEWPFTVWVRIVAFLPILIVAVAFARELLVVKSERAAIAEITQLAEADQLLAHLVHTLQTERGQSVLYLAHVSAPIEQYRQAVDADLSLAQAHLQAHPQCCGISESLDLVRGHLRRIRDEVNDDAPPLTVFGEYTQVINLISSFQISLNDQYAGFERAHGTGIETTILWVRALLDLKEVFGEQRALIGLVLTNDRLGREIGPLGAQLNKLMAEEEEANRIFLASAPADIRAQLIEPTPTRDDLRMQQIRGQLAEAMSNGKASHIYDPASWFALATLRMDRLEALAGGLYASVLHNLSGALEQQQRELNKLGLAAVILSAVLFGVSLLAERRIAGPLRRIALATEGLRRRQLGVPIPFSERSDEIGEIARMLGAFRDEMVRSSRLWRREFALMEASLDAIVVIDRKGVILEFNAAAERMFAVERIWALGTDMKALIIPPRLRDAHQTAFLGHLAGGPSTTIGNRFESYGWRNGAEFPVELTVTRAEEEGETVFVAYIRDISDRKEAEANLRKLVVGVEHNPAGMAITNEGGDIEYVNPAFCAITGYLREEILGKNVRILRSGQTHRDTYNELWKTITSGRSWKGELSNRRKNGEAYWQSAVLSPVRGDTGEITNYFAIMEDITALKEVEQRLEHQARYDRLTGLPNRTSTLESLARMIDAAASGDRKVGVLVVNVDSLSEINERFGIEVGDLAVLEFSHRISDCAAGRGHVGRLEGGTFVVLMPNLLDASAIEAMANRLLESAQFRYSLTGGAAFVTCRVGIAVYPMDGEDGSTLLREAHVALYRAKLAGGNCYHFFSPSMDEEAAATQRLDIALRQALDFGEFRLVYQPIFETQSEALVGMEALVRWTSAEFGEIRPDRFIPVAEQNGFIRPLGEWILREACRQASVWPSLPGRPLVIAVNVSPNQFADVGFADRIHQILADTGLAAERLEIEVTERLVVEPQGNAAHALAELVQQNLRLSIDDFGTGYSALSYLSQYHFHTLKIDRAFVGKMAKSKKDLALVEAIIAMAHGMGIRVIAEGVETVEQHTLLRELGCDFVQGYLLARPLAAEAADLLIRQKFAKESLNAD